MWCAALAAARAARRLLVTKQQMTSPGSSRRRSSRTRNATNQVTSEHEDEQDAEGRVEAKLRSAGSVVLEPTRKAKTSVADVTRMDAPADASALPIRVGSSVGSMWSYWFMTNTSSADAQEQKR